MSFHSITLPPEADLTVNVGDTVQLNITSSGAFCLISNTATFTPALPNGLMPIGKWPNPTQYPLGASATGAGSANYTFSVGKTGCGAVLTDNIGKVIIIKSGKDEKHPK